MTQHLSYLKWKKYTKGGENRKMSPREIMWFGSGYGFRIKNETFAELVDRDEQPLMDISRKQLLRVYHELGREEERARERGKESELEM